MHPNKQIIGKIQYYKRKVCTVSQSVKEKKTFINFNTNYRREIKPVPINIDCRLL